MQRPKNPPIRASCDSDLFCCPTLTANPDGSYTFNRGDGSPPVIIPADCCPTLVDNGDGAFTFDPGNGGPPVTINTAPPVLAFAAGTLTATANGSSSSVNLRGNLVQDLAALDLGYLLPT